MAISFNPMATSNASGMFYTDSSGLVQGEYQFDPVSRQYISGGYVASTETNPMWGGIAIQEVLPLATATAAIGGSISRATTVATITGFTVSTQMSNAIVTPGSSNVGVVSVGQSVQFARLGSGLRLVVQCDPTLVDLDGTIITSQVAWDFTNQKLIAYTTGTALPVKILQVQSGNSKTVSYSSGNATWVNNGTAAVILL